MNVMIRFLFTGLYSLGKKAHQEYKEQKLRSLDNLTLGNNVKLSCEITLPSTCNITVGDNTWMYGSINAFPHNKDCTVSIGKDCYIGDHTRLWVAKKIVIGDRVLIAHNVNIFDTTTHPIDKRIRYEHECVVKTKGMPKEMYSTIYEKPVIIEDDVWIGCNVIILKGVTIGKGSIVGAGSVVTKDVPEDTMVAGNPAVTIKQLKDY